MSLNIEIVEEKKNPLINRKEITFKIDHFGKGTPNRMDVKIKLSAMLGSKEKLTIIKKLKTHFGTADLFGVVYIYENTEDLKYYEPFHIQVRNLPKEERSEIIKAKKKKEPYKHLFNYD